MSVKLKDGVLVFEDQQLEKAVVKNIQKMSEYNKKYKKVIEEQLGGEYEVNVSLSFRQKTQERSSLNG